MIPNARSCPPGRSARRSSRSRSELTSFPRALPSRSAVRPWTQRTGRSAASSSSRASEDSCGKSSTRRPSTAGLSWSFARLSCATKPGPGSSPTTCCYRPGISSSNPSPQKTGRGERDRHVALAEFKNVVLMPEYSASLTISSRPRTAGSWHRHSWLFGSVRTTLTT